AGILNWPATRLITLNQHSFYICAKIVILLAIAEINNPIGVPFIEMHSVDSTNNYAMQQLQKGVARHGVAYFAREQYAGKGQREKQWHAEAGENIILSVIFNTSYLQVSQQFGFSMAIAMAARDLFSFYALNNTFVKWPNDLYWCDRKAGGIL